MRAVAEQVGRSASSGEQKRDRREISLRCITELAGKDEIVAPIVGRLTAPRCHVIERHRRFGETLTAVGADGTVSLEEPPARLRVCDSAGGVRRELKWAMRCAAFGALLATSRAPTSSGAGMIGVERFVLSPDWSRAIAGSMVMVRRTALVVTGAMAPLRPFVEIGRVVKLSRQT